MAKKAAKPSSHSPPSADALARSPSNLKTSPRDPVSINQLAMLVLCIYALGTLAARTAIRFSPQTDAILDYADYALCGLFLVDFLISLFRAPNRWRYFITWKWLDLLSSIPMIEVTRWGRAARIIRVFRVLRGLRATKLLAGLVMRRRVESAFLAASLLALLLIVFCSIAIVHFEDLPGGNIQTAEDAIWWAFTTITTVGYGDRYPITLEGRIVAAILMCGGVGLFGTFSGFLASWFMGNGRNPSESDLVVIRQDLTAVRAALGRLGNGGRARWRRRPPRRR